VNLWSEIESGSDIPDVVTAVIEVPKGSRNKYEYDKEREAFMLDRVLYSPVVYPADYGFIPKSTYDDGDPMDILVLMEQPTFPGCLIEARPIGIMGMIDGGDKDYKILAVPEDDPRPRPAQPAGARRHRGDGQPESHSARVGRLQAQAVGPSVHHVGLRSGRRLALSDPDGQEPLSQARPHRVPEAPDRPQALRKEYREHARRTEGDRRRGSQDADRRQHSQIHARQILRVQSGASQQRGYHERHTLDVR